MGAINFASFKSLKSLVRYKADSHGYEKLHAGKDNLSQTSSIKESKDSVSFSHKEKQTQSIPEKQEATPLQKMSAGIKSPFQALKNKFSSSTPERIHNETIHADGSKTTDYWNGKDYTKTVTTHADGSTSTEFNEEKKFKTSQSITPDGSFQTKTGNYKSFKVLDKNNLPPPAPKSLSERIKNKFFPPPPKPISYSRPWRTERINHLEKSDEKGNPINHHGAEDYTEFEIDFKDGKQYIVNQRNVKKAAILHEESFTGGYYTITRADGTQEHGRY